MIQSTDYLSHHCTDWSLNYYDWPKWLRLFGIQVHYICRASYFMAYGVGVGRSPLEAAMRAVAAMERDKKKIFTGLPEDLDIL